MVESWTKNLLSTMMISGMIGMKRRMSKLKCSVPGSSAVWISGGISHRVFFFSCIAERVRDIVGQQLEIRKESLEQTCKK